MMIRACLNAMFQGFVFFFGLLPHGRNDSIINFHFSSLLIRKEFEHVLIQVNLGTYRLLSLPLNS